MARGAQGRALFTQTNYLELFLFFKLMMHEAHYLWFQSKGPIKTAQSLHFITWALGGFGAIKLPYLYHWKCLRWTSGGYETEHKMKCPCLFSFVFCPERLTIMLNRVVSNKDLGKIFLNLIYTFYKYKAWRWHKRRENTCKEQFVLWTLKTK